MGENHFNMETRLKTEENEKKSKSSKWVIILLSIFVLLSIFTIIALFTYILKDKQKEEVCQTEHCVTIAARMIQSLNKSVNPCDNFYEFACGSWIESNPIPEDKVAITTFNKLKDIMVLNLRAILETPITNYTESDEETMKTLHASCQNIDKINELDKAPLEDLLAKFGGGSLLNNSWSEEDFDLTDVFIKMKFIDSMVFNLVVVLDDANSNSRCIRIEQGHFSSTKSHYTDPQFNKTRQAYMHLLFNIAHLINPSASNQTIQKDLNEVLEFEKALANITLKEEAKRQVKENKIKSLHQLHELFEGAFDFKHYIRSIFHPLTITDNEKISVRTPGYILKLPSILKRTSPRVLANFLSLHVARNYLKHLSQPFLQLKQAYNKVITGIHAEKSRWINCVILTNEHMGDTLGRKYVQKHFDHKAKQRAVDMIQEIKTAFLELVDEAKWMEDSTKKVAKEKVLSMKEHIGYPDYIFNVSYVAEDFKDLKFHKHTYFANIVQYKEVMEKNNLLTLREAVDRNRWGTYPGQINAFYSPNMNQLTFPAGIFQLPFYHEDNLMSLNFGGIGMVIGHELTHGFDDKGSSYDKNGNLNNWWPQLDREKFLNLTKCIVKQYNNYQIHGINVTLNGNLTQGENIADNGGLKQSFRAYEKWLRKHGTEASLPGLPFTNQQLFYINFGQIWCSSIRPEQALQIAKMSKHSPGRYRVMGTLVNSKTFSRVFECPVGSNMNPANKCTVW